MGPKCDHKEAYEREAEGDLHRPGKCNVTSEGEFGVMQPQAKKRPQPLEAGRSKEMEHPLEHPEGMGVSLISFNLDF